MSLANSVEEDTATTGTGVITLGGATSNKFTAFTDALNNLAVVTYLIEDGDDSEIGIGLFTATGTTLTRITVMETIVSGVLDKTAPAAISLTGNAVVSIVGSSYSQQGWSSPASVTGGYVVSNHFTGTYSESFTLVADTLYAMPFFLDFPMAVGSIGDFITGIASSSIRFGIASADSDNLPDQLIAETASLDGTTSTNVTGSLTDVNLTPGLYYALVVSSAAHAISGFAGSLQTWSPLGVGNGRPKIHASGAHTFGAFPSDIGAVTTLFTENTNAPCIRFYR